MVALIFRFCNLVVSPQVQESRLEAENAALRHQLTVLQRKMRVVSRVGVRQGWRTNDAPGGEAIRRACGQADLTRRHRSALVAALARASLLAVTLASEAAATRRVASPASTAKSADKTAKATEKKVAKGKSKDDGDPRDPKVDPIDWVGCIRSWKPAITCCA
jgi:hypothetical protein